MQEQQRKYWAFLANPKVFRVEEAVRELKEDYWTILRSNVRAGDRAIIWKAKGKDQCRGIVALAEILTDPIFIADPTRIVDLNTDFWVDQGSLLNAYKAVNWVKVRYWTPSTLPLWEGNINLHFLKELNVARATGGSIFHVTPDQWDTILERIGDWPVKTSE